MLYQEYNSKPKRLKEQSHFFYKKNIYNQQRGENNVTKAPKYQHMIGLYK